MRSHSRSTAPSRARARGTKPVRTVLAGGFALGLAVMMLVAAPSGTPTPHGPAAAPVPMTEAAQAHHPPRDA